MEVASERLILWYACCIRFRAGSELVGIAQEEAKIERFAFGERSERVPDHGIRSNEVGVVFGGFIKVLLR